MTTKIRIKIGGVDVDYEGPAAFLDKKLPDLVSQLSAHAAQVPPPTEKGGVGAGERSRGGEVGTLAAFLKEKKVGKSQNKRFLAVAQWLHRRGSERLKTADVTKALRENHQSKVGNPSQCLASNVSSGYCEKVGREFFVTDDGRSSLG